MTLKSMNYQIKKIDYVTILPAWEKLWPGREHSAHSSMRMLGGHGPEIRDTYKWTGFGVYDGKRLVGVNAGHKSSQFDYRTRGLWVDPDYRGQGVAQQLFEKLEEQAKYEGSRWLWSFPRLPSLPAYMNAGYIPYGETEHAEFEQNVRAKKDLSLLITSVFHVNDPLLDNNWNTEVEALESANKLLGQNEEVRGNFLHVTQLYVNEFYTMWDLDTIKSRLPTPIYQVKGDHKNTDHVL